MTSAQIKARATELGFDLCGVAPVGDFPELGYLPSWLAEGRAGRMTYLNRTARRRADVRQWQPSARSVIVVACLYNTDRPYSTEIADHGVALIARYASGSDYHRLMTERLNDLLNWLTAASSVAFDARVSVDTGPVQERVYAQRAGIGWIGKNTCVINPELGSWILLGELITSLPLEPDTPALDQCGTCTLCLEACPTHAIVEPRVLDARLCLSYLTIEIKGSIPVEQRAGMGAHVFGCDICQDVCPYNLREPRVAGPEWAPRPALDRPRLVDLWSRSDRGLEDAIEGTALVRRGVAGLRRNLAVALGNSGDAATRRALAEPPSDTGAPSLSDPVIAEHLAWARERCGR
ncbi:MAG: tRNA epoxyqueuosine(34) reductase QueG [Acidobacteria bacterium]|nr:tRNA epoxyqueuosine(34) reductase QueG [Acidobacteriota bacterium]